MDRNVSKGVEGMEKVLEVLITKSDYREITMRYAKGIENVSTVCECI
jgi:hypothetical protein